jgi:AcrR family transcriptional regulator
MARTRAEDFETKRQSLLACAAAVMAEEGVERASMSRIAARAQVSKALLYHYYPGKDALIFDIIHSHLQALETAILRADGPELKPHARLRALIRATLEAYRDADDRHKVQLAGTAHLPEDRRLAVQTIERRIVRHFADAIARINPALDGERALLIPVTMSLFGIMNWLYLWFKEDGQISRADYADVVADLMLGGLGALPSAPATAPDPAPKGPRP